DLYLSRSWCVRVAASFILQNLSLFLCDSHGAQSEIDVPHARTRRRFAKIANIDSSQNLLGDISRILTALLREHERGVGLIIAKTRVACRRQLTGVWQLCRSESIS